MKKIILLIFGLLTIINADSVLAPYNFTATHRYLFPANVYDCLWNITPSDSLAEFTVTINNLVDFIIPFNETTDTTFWCRLGREDI